ncbi:MAG: site-2 protease family protein [Acidimicrobiia bacterium]|nr:site-2 protease family protein [Acidimicrobiia bacterium]MDQ3391716.1 site-2 protease family protein [Actinomycetota bacterium]
MSRFEQLKNELGGGGSVTEPVVVNEQPAGPSPLSSGLATAAILGLLVWLGFTNPWMLVFAVGILISVFLHELGHFITARWTGMKATQFFLGIGPRLWSFRRGETEYGLRAVPVAAFVRIIGMSNLDEVPPQDEARTYRQQSYPKRMLVISAGSLMHIVIAILLLFSVFGTRGELRDVDGARVVALEKGGPAELAGVESDDIITGIDGTAVADPEELGEIVRTSQPGDPVTITVRRDGELRDIEASLGANTDEDSPNFGRAMLGVGTNEGAEFVDVSIATAATKSVTELGPVTWQSAKGVFTVLNPVNIYSHVVGDNDDITTRPTTLVGVTQVSGVIGDSQGLVGVIYLLAILNVFVGVFNMFPLLPLDGGHAAIATYERLRSRNGRRYFADITKMMPFAVAVMAVLLVLFMSGLYLDVTEPLG